MMDENIEISKVLSSNFKHQLQIFESLDKSIEKMSSSGADSKAIITEYQQIEE